jgi:hypothetical protein
MDNLFDGDGPAPLDPDKDYFSELVGEGRKFKDPKDLARSKMESDRYIKTLEGRLDELRNDYIAERQTNMAKQNLDDLLNKARQQPTLEPEPKNSEVKYKPDPEEFDSLFSSNIRKYEEQKKAQENFNLVKTKLKERFGSNYHESIQQEMDRLGLSTEDANTLARRSPTAFFKMIDQPRNPDDNFQAPPRSSSGFAPRLPKPRTWSYYQDLKKTKPNLYYDKKIAVQMHNDAIAQGESFYDGDFGLNDKQLLSRLS